MLKLLKVFKQKYLCLSGISLIHKIHKISCVIWNCFPHLLTHAYYTVGTAYAVEWQFQAAVEKSQV